MTTHSPLGASSSKRWMACPGSVRLAEGIGNKDSEWSQEGTLAHEVAAACLKNGADAWEHIGSMHEELAGLRVDDEMVETVQLYLDTIRADAGPDAQMVVETKFRLPQDKRLFGTADCILSETTTLRVYDLKYGKGITVEVEDNSQFLYYAAGALAELGRHETVEIVVVQPRAWHEDGAVRRWVVPVELVEEWVETQLLPAVRATEAPDAPLVPGDHCRFCPAGQAGLCPAQKQQLGELVELKGEPAEAAQRLSNDELERLLGMIEPVRMMIRALEGEAYERKLRGEAGAPGKLVAKKSDRVFKDGAEAAAADAWGEGAYERKLLSPARMEKLTGGKEFVASWAYKPDTGVTWAPAADRRAEVRPRLAKEVFAGLIATE